MKKILILLTIGLLFCVNNQLVAQGQGGGPPQGGGGQGV